MTVVAAFVIVAVVGSSVFVLLHRRNEAVGPPPATASPTASASLSPTEFVWSPEAAESDWPGPIREEPLGGSDVVALGQVDDPMGDAGPSAPSWFDIQRVERDSGSPQEWISVELTASVAVELNPERAWMAFGVVLDTDRDGVADRRVGMDNANGRTHREWITVLATGETSANLSGSYGHSALGVYVDSYYLNDEFVGESWSRVGLRLAPRGYRMYAWAGLIQDGRLVATDFAPDSGWLDNESLLPSATPAPAQARAHHFAVPFSYAPPADLSLLNATPSQMEFVHGSAESCPRYGSRPIHGSRGLSVVFSPSFETYGRGYGDSVALREGSFFEDLSRNILLEVGPRTHTELGGLAGRRATVRYGSSGLGGYPDLHDATNEFFLSLQCPSQLTVAEVGGGFVVVQVWAATEFDLELWLPEANRFVESMAFDFEP